jgi:hypothetical protein
MKTPRSASASVRYTTLSDRFRSLWTFYQFLSGVLKHLGEGPIAYSYDFQGLHRRLQELVHTVGLEGNSRAATELDQVERELDRIHRELARIEGEFPPSALRKFFDHIKRQDEKVLCALIKFYLLYKHFEQDTLDKLDILLTRLAEAPADDGQAVPRDPDDLARTFQKLSEFTNLPELPAAELSPLVEAVLSIRRELQEIDGYTALVESKVYDRYRRLKQRLGRTALHPVLMVEITTTNIAAKNRFKELFETEEKKVVEKTNRIYEIERYLTHHPELATDDLQQQLEDFRHFRIRYESGRRKENVKRDDITEMTSAMQAVLARFDPAAGRSPAVAEAPREGDLFTAPPDLAPRASITMSGTRSEPDLLVEGVDEPGRRKAMSITDLLPPDPLLNETLHKIMFALEMVVWERLPSQISQSSEITNLRLESWEAESYRKLAEQSVEKGTAERELLRFFLSSAALRVKMEEEAEEIGNLETNDNAERLAAVLENSAQSLERARDTDHRFQWFVDDMLFRGDTHKLEQVYRSRFRFLHAYSKLWLDHQRCGGLTPL